jgi:4'-phosphopantetheinyl transferase
VDDFRLASDEVHVWCAPLDLPAPARARFHASLASDERERGARLHFQRDRERFVVAHGVLRELLGRYLRIEPRHIRYVREAFGKPAFSPPPGSRIQFNLSHSAGLALIAITAEAAVGVDVEAIRCDGEFEEWAHELFSPSEADRIRALPREQHAEAFLREWTRQEACLKACGLGLAAALPRQPIAPVADPGDRPWILRAQSSDRSAAMRWSVLTLRPAPGYIGALAIRGRGWRVTEHRWKSQPC